MPAQAGPLVQAVGSSCFGIDIIKEHNHLIHGLGRLKPAHPVRPVICQCPLAVKDQMGMDRKATACHHVFTFTQSPLPVLSIDSEIITLTVEKARRIKKSLTFTGVYLFATNNRLNYILKHSKNIFTRLSTLKKFSDDDINDGYDAEFSTSQLSEKGIRNTRFVFSREKKKYTLSLFLNDSL